MRVARPGSNMLMAAHWIELNLTATEGVPVLGAEVVGTAVVGGSEGALVGCEVHALAVS